MMTRAPLQRWRPALWVRAAAIAVGAAGVIALVGWVFDISAFKGIAPGLPTMKANTAVCFIVSALALGQTGAAAPTRRWRASQWLPLIVGAVGVLTLIEYASGFDLHIDQLLFLDPTSSSHSIPGRMSAVTATEFVLFAASMALYQRRSAAANIAFLITMSLGLLIAFLALTGYAYGVRLLYAPIPQSSIALHTAAAFLVLFLGLAALRPDLGWVALLRSQTTTGALVRRLLPAIVLIPLVLGGMILNGARAELYEARDGIALFALASVAALGAVVWAGGVYANRLGARLENREHVFQTVVETALDAFILMDAQGRVLEWNPQAERLFAWSRAEAIGRPVADLIIPAPLRPRHAAGLNTFLATGDSVVLRRRVEVNAIRRDGVEFPAELMILPVRQGESWVFSGFVKDLSALREAEAQVRQAQKMEAVGQLTGGVAHDFNNLLTVIIATLDVLLGRVSEEVRPKLENVLAAAERGAEMIGQLLAFSRKQALNPEPLDLAHVASSTLDMLKRLLGEQVEIVFAFAPVAWRAFADRGQVENALLNLAINARDAMPDGGKLTIEIANVQFDDDHAARHAGVAPGAYVVLAVSDSGVGMAPAVLERVFEPFFTTKETGRGSGLGLSMVYGFAKQSNGHVKIYSEEGHGTTVRLYLPRLVGDGPHAPRPATLQAEDQGGAETILLVEDDAQVRAIAASQLDELGYTVMEASNAAEALVLLAGETPIDLLFTDVVMPGKTGRQLAKEAQEMRPSLKTLFTSGYTDNAIVHHGRLDPDVRFLAKPYRRRDLGAAVRAALSAKR
jgi:PAS domain S-box-containing protein